MVLAPLLPAIVTLLKVFVNEEAESLAVPPRLIAILLKLLVAVPLPVMSVKPLTSEAAFFNVRTYSPIFNEAAEEPSVTPLTVELSPLACAIFSVLFLVKPSTMSLPPPYMKRTFLAVL